MDLGDLNRKPVGLFEPPQNERRRSLMSAIDEINSKFGRGRTRFAAQGEPDASWHMKRKMKSGHLTTSWDEFVSVKS